GNRSSKVQGRAKEDQVKFGVAKTPGEPALMKAASGQSGKMRPPRRTGRPGFRGREGVAPCLRAKYGESAPRYRAGGGPAACGSSSAAENVECKAWSWGGPPPPPVRGRLQAGVGRCGYPSHPGRGGCG